MKIPELKKLEKSIWYNAIVDWWRIKMLNVLKDGPFRYIHCAATGGLLLTLVKSGNRFIEYDGEDASSAPIAHTLRQWKLICRRRFDKRLITDQWKVT